jgi:hypothetical protein
MSNKIKEEKIESNIPKGFGELKDVEPNIWKPEEDGDNIQGILVNKEARSGELSARYFIDDNEGIKLVWGCKVLNSRMELVNIGDFVKITYKGLTETKKGRKLHLYKVEAAERSKQ